MKKLSALAQLFLVLLSVYTLMRLAFGYLHLKSFEINAVTLLKAIAFGIVIDLSSLIYINFFFILFYLLVLPAIPGRWRQRSLLFVLLLSNLPFIALNLLDLFYYKFNSRRSTIDILYAIPDAIHSFGSLFREYWWLVTVFLVLCIVLFVVFRRITRNSEAHIHPRWYIHLFVSVLLIAVFAWAARGPGNRPVSPASPLLYFDPLLQPFVNNSTHNFIFSVLQTRSRLTEKKYFDSDRVHSICPLEKKYEQSAPFTGKNVVIFLLESMPEAAFGRHDQQPVMPFLDSLRSHSLVVTQAYQNGHESVKGTVAALASIPPFLHEPFFVSNYNHIPFEGLGKILGKQGYSTNFFLGAEYDHFNFAKLCRMVGIENYYAKENLPDWKEMDDGTWGIYDEFFFDYFFQMTDTISEPFFNVLYNISSHPPFNIPDSRKEQFSGPDPQLNAFRYVDFCFRELFGKMQLQRWFTNTVFFFISDHTAPMEPGYPYWHYLKNRHIPFFIYDPSDTAGRELPVVSQQLDLVPTILDKLNYSQPFFSFGNSIYRQAGGYSISNVHEIYQLIDANGVTGYNIYTDEVVYFYDPAVDPVFAGNRKQDADPASVDMIRAILQQYHSSLLRNAFR